MNHNGTTYQCEQPAWCSSEAAFYYEPGKGLAWQSAWSKVSGASVEAPVNTQPGNTQPGDDWLTPLAKLVNNHSSSVKIGKYDEFGQLQIKVAGSNGLWFSVFTLGLMAFARRRRR